MWQDHDDVSGLEVTKLFGSFAKEKRGGYSRKEEENLAHIA